jgi:hypothetical protein
VVGFHRKQRSECCRLYLSFICRLLAEYAHPTPHPQPHPHTQTSAYPSSSVRRGVKLEGWAASKEDDLVLVPPLRTPAVLLPFPPPPTPPTAAAAAAVAPVVAPSLRPDLVASAPLLAPALAVGDSPLDPVLSASAC